MKRTILLAIVVAVAAAIAYRIWWLPQPPPAAPVAAAPPPAPQAANPAPAAPPVRHTLPPPAAQAAPLPRLEASDGFMVDALAGLLGRPAVAHFFHLDKIVLRLVATIDNLPRGRAPVAMMPVKPVPGSFLVSRDDGGLVIAPDNAARYGPYVRLLAAVDARKAVDLYVRLYPLFQQAYEELGYPKGYFNDRLVAALDDLLDAPVAPEPIRLAQPKVLYTFADADLEARSAGQKILMRMGSANAAKVKAKLAEIREELGRRSTG